MSMVNRMGASGFRDISNVDVHRLKYNYECVSVHMYKQFSGFIPVKY